MSFNEIIEKYISLGFKVFPVHHVDEGGFCSCGKRNCANIGKHPRTKNGVKDATSDLAQIAEWQENYGDFNIGIATGDGLTIIDVDTHKIDGYDSLRQLQQKLGELPKTLSVKTGGGGLHIYYKADVPNTVDRGLGIDTRGAGGYVVAPPSNHISGKSYEFLYDTEIAELPPKWVDYFKTKTSKRKVTSLPQSIGEGERNATLFQLACSLRAKGVNEEAIFQAVKATNEKQCIPPLSEREIETIVKSALKYEAGVPRTTQGLIDIDNLDVETLISQEVADYVMSIGDITERTRELVKLSNKANELNCKRQFSQWIKSYANEKPKVQVNQGFKMPLDLDIGDYAINHKGIHRIGDNGLECVCPQPLQITKRLINVETDSEKVELSYYKDGHWRSTIANKMTIADKRSIIQLSSRGIGVNSETSKSLVNYLFELENLNVEHIPKSYSISHLGWTNKGQFTPYTPEIEFDGEMYYKQIYDAVKPQGSLKKWLNIAVGAMKSPIMRLAMACSFASPLLEPLHLQIFFMHLWGGTEVGKTVALHLAMSAWGNPQLLVRNWNSTAVGLERLAGFLNSVPLALDELQVVKSDRYNRTDSSIYMLGTGMGKSRGNKAGGLDSVPRWNLTVLTNGEQPLTDDNSNGGAKNRTLEIYCNERIFSNAGEVVDCISKNNGAAGKRFVESLKEIDTETLLRSYKTIYRQVLAMNKFTDKQINAVSVLMLADALFNVFFFDVDIEVAISASLEFLGANLALFNSSKDIYIGDRLYDDIIGWITSNKAKFSEHAQECYGIINSDYCSIIASKLREYLDTAGYNYNAALKELANNNKIEVGADKKSTKPCRVNGILARCVVLKFDIFNPFIHESEDLNF